MSTTSPTAGGVAASTGDTFEAAVTAWFLANLLLEENSIRLTGADASEHIENVCRQTTQPVDDINVRTDRRSCFINVKRSLSFGKVATSELASVLGQFVRQGRSGSGSLFLVTSSASPRTVTRDLLEVLDEIRGGKTLAAIKSTKAAYRSALERVEVHVRRIWTTESGVVASTQDIVSLLERCYVLVLDVFDSERDAESIKALLATQVRDATQIEGLWAALLNLAGHLARTRGSMTLQQLQSWLTRNSFELSPTPSFVAEVEWWKALTVTSRADLARHTRLARGRGCIRRLLEPTLAAGALDGHLLVVGSPGSGKTGLLSQFVEARVDEGTDVVVLKAGNLSSDVLLQRALDSQTGLVRVLENWPGVEPAFVVIDGLDEALGGSARQGALSLVRGLAERAGRWRCVVSIREYDFCHASELVHLFAGTPLTTVTQGRSIPSARYTRVTKLTDEELGQLAGQLPELHDFVGHASQRLRALLGNVFNLGLLADLTSTDMERQRLLEATSRYELLQAWWGQRVLDQPAEVESREVYLAAACDEMLSRRALRASRRRVRARAQSAVSSLHALQQNEVLIADTNFVRFPHRILFDFAIAHHCPSDHLEEGLAFFLEDFAWRGVFLRPSLHLYLDGLWLDSSDRSRFWQFAFSVYADDHAPPLLRIAAPGVATHRAEVAADFGPVSEPGITADLQTRIGHDLASALESGTRSL